MSDCLLSFKLNIFIVHYSKWLMDWNTKGRRSFPIMFSSQVKDVRIKLSILISFEIAFELSYFSWKLVCFNLTLILTHREFLPSNSNSNFNTSWIFACSDRFKQNATTSIFSIIPYKLNLLEFFYATVFRRQARMKSLLL